MISVIMSVYNCENTVKKAIESIQNQTYQDWEMIVCDDGSTDNTVSVIKNIKDERIKLIRNKKNRGLTFSLNNCLKFAQGEYIARMDGDDWSTPDRFEKEIKVLQENKYPIVSSWMTLVDEDGNTYNITTEETPEIENLVRHTAIFHAPVMMKKECMDAVNGYNTDKKCERVEDVDLWFRLYKKGYRCYNIQEPLYFMEHGSGTKRRKYKYRLNSVRVRLKACKDFHLSPVCYLQAIKPAIIGLIPANIRLFLRKRIEKS